MSMIIPDVKMHYTRLLFLIGCIGMLFPSYGANVPQKPQQTKGLIYPIQKPNRTVDGQKKKTEEMLALIQDIFKVDKSKEEERKQRTKKVLDKIKKDGYTFMRILFPANKKAMENEKKFDWETVKLSQYADAWKYIEWFNGSIAREVGIHINFPDDVELSSKNITMVPDKLKILNDLVQKNWSKAHKNARFYFLQAKIKQEPEMDWHNVDWRNVDWSKIEKDAWNKDKDNKKQLNVTDPAIKSFKLDPEDKNRYDLAKAIKQQTSAVDTVIKLIQNSGDNEKENVKVIKELCLPKQEINQPWSWDNINWRSVNWYLLARLEEEKLITTEITNAGLKWILNILNIDHIDQQSKPFVKQFLNASTKSKNALINYVFPINSDRPINTNPITWSKVDFNEAEWQVSIKKKFSLPAFIIDPKVINISADYLLEVYTSYDDEHKRVKPIITKIVLASEETKKALIKKVLFPEIQNQDIDQKDIQWKKIKWTDVNWNHIESLMDEKFISLSMIKQNAPELELNQSGVKVLIRVLESEEQKDKTIAINILVQHKNNLLQEILSPLDGNWNQMSISKVLEELKLLQENKIIEWEDVKLRKKAVDNLLFSLQDEPKQKQTAINILQAQGKNDLIKKILPNSDDDWIGDTEIESESFISTVLNKLKFLQKNGIIEWQDVKLSIQGVSKILNYAFSGTDHKPIAIELLQNQDNLREAIFPKNTKEEESWAWQNVDWKNVNWYKLSQYKENKLVDFKDVKLPGDKAYELLGLNDQIKNTVKDIVKASPDNLEKMLTQAIPDVTVGIGNVVDYSSAKWDKKNDTNLTLLLHEKIITREDLENGGLKGFKLPEDDEEVPETTMKSFVALLVLGVGALGFYYYYVLKNFQPLEEPKGSNSIRERQLKRAKKRNTIKKLQNQQKEEPVLPAKASLDVVPRENGHSESS